MGCLFPKLFLLISQGNHRVHTSHGHNDDSNRCELQPLTENEDLLGAL